MKKIEQLIKELQLHINNPSLNQIVEEKMNDAWRDAHSDENRAWVARHEAYWNNYKKWLTPEEMTKMAKSHFFQSTSDYGDEEMCYKCQIELDDFEREPQYCEYKEPSKL